jgi:AcrR family transcriptional regulator
MPGPKPLRSDARRNFEALVASANEAFTEKGTLASLDDIAEAAGVGNATLYRHFPTRDSLVVEAMRFQFSELGAVAREVSGDHPDAALETWLVQLASSLGMWRGLPDMIASATATSPLRTACQPLRLQTQRFLLGAQEGGSARNECTPEDLFDLALMLAWSFAAQGEPRLRRRVSILLSGLLLVDPAT